MRAAPTLVALFALTACSTDVVIEMRYTSENLVAAVREVEIYVFETASCEPFDPVGAPNVDAATRGGATAVFAKQTRPGEEDLAEAPDLGGASYTVVIDGYGPACEETRRSNGESACTRFNPDKPRVHRAHGCLTIDSASDGGRTIPLAMVQTAPLGSLVNVEEIGLVVYDDERPLPLVDGFAAREPLVVQLLDDSSETVDGAPVHWRVSKGSGFIDEPQPTLSRPGTYDTSNQTDVEGKGLAFGSVHAGVRASEEEEGELTVEAYIPGYENSPRLFKARAVPAVSAEVETVSLDPSQILLAKLDDIQPLLVEDFDQDGLADFAFASYDRTCSMRTSTHRLGVLFGGTAQPVISAIGNGMIYSMAWVNDGGGGKRLLTFISDPCAEAFVDSATRVQNPAVEGWEVTRTELIAAGRLTSELTCDADNNCTPRALDKIAISTDVADLDPLDGLQEIAVSRCSFSVGRSRPVDCYAMIESNHDGEVAVLRPQFTDGRLTSIVAVSRLEAENTMSGASEPGGFGEARFADLNADGLPDLTWARPTLALSLCSENFPQSGFELGNPQRIFQHPASLTGGYSIGVGDFTDRPGKDVIISGGFRASGPSSGATLIESSGCTFRDEAAEVLIGPRSTPASVLVRVANLNRDVRDDALVLHRAQGELHLYFGSGTIDLAAGPVIELGSRRVSSLAVGDEGGEDDPRVVAAAYSSEENKLLIIRLRPANP